jgi:deoxyribonuclease V
MEKEDNRVTSEDIAKKLGINLDKLIADQNKFAKLVVLADEMDFSLAENAAGCATALLGNKIISSIVICNKKFEVIEQNYSMRRVDFPYLPEFRAYRELPVMIDCFNKLENTPDVVFVEGQGIAHPRKIGIASHLGISIQRPTIGIAQKLLAGKLSENNIMIGGEEVGFSFVAKQGSNPIYISPGHMISLNTSLELTKKFLKYPHKLPEPIVMARRYGDKIRKEIAKSHDEL